MLTLHSAAAYGSGNDMSGWGTVYQYKVNGLPVGEQALIAENEHCWQFMRISQRKQGKWTGEYKSPDAALQALEQVLRAIK